MSEALPDNILKVALCQHDIVWENARATIARIESPLLRYCEKHGPDLMVLPETFNVGFTMNPAVAEDDDGESTMWLRRMAARCGAAFIASAPVRESGPSGGEVRYNRCRFRYRAGLARISA